MEKIISIFPVAKWGGAVEYRGKTESGETVIVADPVAASKILVDALNSHGFVLDRAPRQEFRRLNLV